MTQIQHTPGPWHWAKCRTQQHLHDASGSCFAGISMPMPTNRKGIWAEPEYAAQMEANARLIAAAPELLEVCYNAYRALTAEQRSTPDGQKIAAVIAKARGE